MQNFITKEGLVFYCYTIDTEQYRKIDAFLSALQESGVEEIIQKASNEQKIGRPRVSPYAMFATILFGFAFGATTLRSLESSCRHDTRFIYLMDEEKPDYSTFSKFFNRVILPHAVSLYPRSRGEKPNIADFGALHSETPPLTRGKANHIAINGRRVRNTPRSRGEKFSLPFLSSGC